jgi:hypothetical protein
MDYYYENNLCEICEAYREPSNGQITMDVYWINTHCIELRRNREARQHKNFQPKSTVF